MVKKVISGGQTGIDQMGLEVAEELGIETGGCAPVEFFTEIGPCKRLETDFGLTEISPHEIREMERLSGKTDRYTPRTFINARESDGTVYFSAVSNPPGAITTQNGCKTFHKPFILNPTIDELVLFIQENSICTLNVAGNRASKMTTRDYQRFRSILRQALSEINK